MTIDEAYNTCFGNPYIVPIDKHEETKRIIRDVMEEVKQYRELGTVEELRIAKEKQIPKKPIFNYNLSDTSSVFHCECGNIIKVSHDIGIMDNNNAPNYCSKCGCRLDWSDSD